MEHAPIYRSTSPRRTTTGGSLVPWQRTASLASAAVALTVSGIALGSHGFAPTTSTTVAPPSVGAPNAAVPVPGISVALAGGGHPDLISTLSAALIARFRLNDVPILALPFPPGAPPTVVAPPQATPEPFVRPATVLDPTSAPTELPLDVASVPLTEDAGTAQIAEAAPVAQISVNFQPLATARAAARIPVTDSDAAAPEVPQADAAAPQEQVAAAVQPQPTAAPAQAAPRAASVAPVHVATPVPVVHKEPTPVPVAVKPAPVPDRDAPPPAPAAKPDNDKPAPHGGDAKPNNASSKGKSGGSSHGG